MSQYYYRPFPLDVLMLIERQGQYVLMYINCLDIIVHSYVPVIVW